MTETDNFVCILKNKLIRKNKNISFCLSKHLPIMAIISEMMLLMGSNQANNFIKNVKLLA